MLIQAPYLAQLIEWADLRKSSARLSHRCNTKLSPWNVHEVFMPCSPGWDRYAIMPNITSILVTTSNVAKQVMASWSISVSGLYNHPNRIEWNAKTTVTCDLVPLSVLVIVLKARSGILQLTRLHKKAHLAKMTSKPEHNKHYLSLRGTFLLAIVNHFLLILPHPSSGMPFVFEANNLSLPKFKKKTCY